MASYAGSCTSLDMNNIISWNRKSDRLVHPQVIFFHANAIVLSICVNLILTVPKDTIEDLLYFFNNLLYLLLRFFLASNIQNYKRISKAHKAQVVQYLSALGSVTARVPRITRFFFIFCAFNCYTDVTDLAHDCAVNITELKPWLCAAQQEHLCREGSHVSAAVLNLWVMPPTRIAGQILHNTKTMICKSIHLQLWRGNKIIFMVGGGWSPQCK